MFCGTQKNYLLVCLINHVIGRQDEERSTLLTTCRRADGVRRLGLFIAAPHHGLSSGCLRVVNAGFEEFEVEQGRRRVRGY